MKLLKMYIVTRIQVCINQTQDNIIDILLISYQSLTLYSIMCTKRILKRLILMDLRVEVLPRVK
jgi:hypothetical protein